MRRIVQFGVGVDEQVKARLERLRACLGVSRSRVTERALVEGGLDHLERVYAREVSRFNDLASAGSMTWEAYAHEYGRRYASQTYPPTVGQLEGRAKGGEPLVA